MDKKDISKIINALRYRNMDSIALSLRNAYSYVEESSQLGSLLNSVLSTFVICLPVEDFYKFKDLFNLDRNLVMKIVLDIYPPKENSVEICDIRLEILDKDKDKKEEIVNSNIDNNGKLRIFISYSSKYNKEIAGILKKLFEEYDNIQCFVAHDDIIHGSEWEKEIIKNLDSTNLFMPIQTKHLESSYWCQQE